MRKTLAATLLAAVLWGTSFPVIRIGLEQGGAAPLTFVTLRFVLAVLVLAPFALARHAREVWAFLRRPAVWGVAVFNAAGYALQFLAQDRTTASKTSLLVDINAVFVAVVSVILLRERLGRGIWIALGVGVAGAALLSTGGSLEAVRFSNREFVGDALALAAGIVWAFSFVGIKHLLDTAPLAHHVAFTTALLTMTTLLLAVPALVFEGFGPMGGPVAWASIAYLAVFSTSVAFLLWQYGLQEFSATVSSIVLLLEILVAVAIGVAFLGERMSGWAAVGGVLVTVAAALAARASAPAAPPAPADASPGPNP